MQTSWVKLRACSFFECFSIFWIFCPHPPWSARVFSILFLCERCRIEIWHLLGPAYPAQGFSGYTRKNIQQPMKHNQTSEKDSHNPMMRQKRTDRIIFFTIFEPKFQNPDLRIQFWGRIFMHILNFRSMFQDFGVQGPRFRKTTFSIFFLIRLPVYLFFYQGTDSSSAGEDMEGAGGPGSHSQHSLWRFDGQSRNWWGLKESYEKSLIFLSFS